MPIARYIYNNEVRYSEVNDDSQIDNVTNIDKNARVFLTAKNGEVYDVKVQNYHKALMDKDANGNPKVVPSTIDDVNRYRNKELEDERLVPLFNDLTEWNDLNGEDFNSPYTQLLVGTLGVESDVGKNKKNPVDDNGKVLSTALGATQIVDKTFDYIAKTIKHNPELLKKVQDYAGVKEFKHSDLETNDRLAIAMMDIYYKMQLEGKDLSNMSQGDLYRFYYHTDENEEDPSLVTKFFDKQGIYLPAYQRVHKKIKDGNINLLYPNINISISRPQQLSAEEPQQTDSTQQATTTNEDGAQGAPLMLTPQETQQADKAQTWNPVPTWAEQANQQEPTEEENVTENAIEQARENLFKKFIPIADKAAQEAIIAENKQAADKVFTPSPFGGKYGDGMERRFEAQNAAIQVANNTKLPRAESNGMDKALEEISQTPELQQVIKDKYVAAISNNDPESSHNERISDFKTQLTGLSDKYRENGGYMMANVLDKAINALDSLGNSSSDSEFEQAAEEVSDMTDEEVDANLQYLIDSGQITTEDVDACNALSVEIKDSFDDIFAETFNEVSSETYAELANQYSKQFGMQFQPKTIQDFILRQAISGSVIGNAFTSYGGSENKAYYDAAMAEYGEKAGTLANVASGVLSMMIDAPLFKGGGALGSMAAKAIMGGTEKGLALILAKQAVKKGAVAAAEGIAESVGTNTVKALVSTAKASKATKLMLSQIKDGKLYRGISLATNSVLSSAGSFGVYDAVSAASNATRDDLTNWSYYKNVLSAGGRGSAVGAMLAPVNYMKNIVPRSVEKTIGESALKYSTKEGASTVNKFLLNTLNRGAQIGSRFAYTIFAEAPLFGVSRSIVDGTNLLSYGAMIKEHAPMFVGLALTHKATFGIHNAPIRMSTVNNSLSKYDYEVINKSLKSKFGEGASEVHSINDFYKLNDSEIGELFSKNKASEVPMSLRNKLAMITGDVSQMTTPSGLGEVRLDFDENSRTTTVSSYDESGNLIEQPVVFRSNDSARAYQRDMIANAERVDIGWRIQLINSVSEQSKGRVKGVTIPESVVETLKKPINMRTEAEILELSNFQKGIVTSSEKASKEMGAVGVVAAQLNMSETEVYNALRNTGRRATQKDIDVQQMYRSIIKGETPIENETSKAAMDEINRKLRAAKENQSPVALTPIEQAALFDSMTYRERIDFINKNVVSADDNVRLRYYGSNSGDATNVLYKVIEKTGNVVYRDYKGDEIEATQEVIADIEANTTEVVVPKEELTEQLIEKEERADEIAANTEREASGIIRYKDSQGNERNGWYVAESDKEYVLEDNTRVPKGSASSVLANEGLIELPEEQVSTSSTENVDAIDAAPDIISEETITTQTKEVTELEKKQLETLKRNKPNSIEYYTMLKQLNPKRNVFAELEKAIALTKSRLTKLEDDLSMLEETDLSYNDNIIKQQEVNEKLRELQETSDKYALEHPEDVEAHKNAKLLIEQKAAQLKIEKAEKAAKEKAEREQKAKEKAEQLKTEKEAKAAEKAKEAAEKKANSMTAEQKSKLIALMIDPFNEKFDIKAFMEQVGNDFPEAATATRMTLATRMTFDGLKFSIQRASKAISEKTKKIENGLKSTSFAVRYKAELQNKEWKAKVVELNKKVAEMNEALKVVADTNKKLTKEYARFQKSLAKSTSGDVTFEAEPKAAEPQKIVTKGKETATETKKVDKADEAKGKEAKSVKTKDAKAKDAKADETEAEAEPIEIELPEEQASTEETNVVEAATDVVKDEATTTQTKEVSEVENKQLNKLKKDKPNSIEYFTMLKKLSPNLNVFTEIEKAYFAEGAKLTQLENDLSALKETDTAYNDNIAKQKEAKKNQQTLRETAEKYALEHPEDVKAHKEAKRSAEKTTQEESVATEEKTEATTEKPKTKRTSNKTIVVKPKTKTEPKAKAKSKDEPKAKAKSKDKAKAEAKDEAKAEAKDEDVAKVEEETKVEEKAEKPTTEEKTDAELEAKRKETMTGKTYGENLNLEWSRTRVGRTITEKETKNGKQYETTTTQYDIDVEGSTSVETIGKNYTKLDRLYEVNSDDYENNCQATIDKKPRIQEVNTYEVVTDANGNKTRKIVSNEIVVAKKGELSFKPFREKFKTESRLAKILENKFKIKLRYGNEGEFNDAGQVAFYDRENQEIVINKNADLTDQLEATLIHEFYHSFMPEAQKKIAAAVKKYYYENTDGRSWEKDIKEKIDLYKRHKRTLTEEQAGEEIIAELLGTKLFDSAEFIKLLESADTTTRMSLIGAIKVYKDVLTSKGIEAVVKEIFSRKTEKQKLFDELQKTITEAIKWQEETNKKSKFTDFKQKGNLYSKVEAELQKKYGKDVEITHEDIIAEIWNNRAKNKEYQKFIDERPKAFEGLLDTEHGSSSDIDTSYTEVNDEEAAEKNAKNEELAVSKYEEAEAKSQELSKIKADIAKIEKQKATLAKAMKEEILPLKKKNPKSKEVKEQFDKNIAEQKELSARIEQKAKEMKDVEASINKALDDSGASLDLDVEDVMTMNSDNPFRVPEDKKAEEKKAEEKKTEEKKPTELQKVKIKLNNMRLQAKSREEYVARAVDYLKQIMKANNNLVSYMRLNSQLSRFTKAIEAASKGVTMDNRTKNLDEAIFLIQKNANDILLQGVYNNVTEFIGKTKFAQKTDRGVKKVGSFAGAEQVYLEHLSKLIRKPKKGEESPISDAAFEAVDKEYDDIANALYNDETLTESQREAKEEKLYDVLEKKMAMITARNIVTFKSDYKSEIKSIDEANADARKQLKRTDISDTERATYQSIVDSYRERTLSAQENFDDRIKNVQKEVFDASTKSKEERALLKTERKQFVDDIVNKSMSEMPKRATDGLDYGIDSAQAREAMADTFLRKLRNLGNAAYGSFHYMIRNLSVSRSASGTVGTLSRHFEEKEGEAIAKENNIKEVADAKNRTLMKKYFGDKFGKTPSFFRLMHAADEIVTDAEGKPLKMEMFKKVYKTDSFGNKVLDENGKPIVDRIESKGSFAKEGVTIAEAMDILLAADQVKGKRMLMEKSGLPALSIEYLREVMRTRYPEWVDYSKGLRDEVLSYIGEEAQLVHKKLYGIPFNYEHNYFPIAAISSSRGKVVDKGSAVSSITPDTMISRSENRLGNFKLGNAFEKANSYTKEMTHWTAWSEVARDANDIFGNADMTRAVKNLFGEGFYKQLKQYTNLLVGVNDVTSINDGVFGKILAWSKSAAISLRLVTALKQITSLPTHFGYKADLEYHKILLKNIANGTLGGSLRGSNVKWCYDNLPRFKARLESGNIGESYLGSLRVSDAKTRLGMFTNKAKKVGMAANHAVDAFTIAAGARSVYEYEYGRLTKLGVSEANAHREALRHAEIEFNSTQATNESGSVSLGQRSSHVTIKTIFSFTSSPLSYIKKNINNIKDLVTHKAYKEERLKINENYYRELGVDSDNAKLAAQKDYNREVLSSIIGVMSVVSAGAMFKGFGYMYAHTGNDKKDDKIKDDAMKSAMLSAFTLGVADLPIFSEAIDLALYASDSKKMSSTQMKRVIIDRAGKTFVGVSSKAIETSINAAYAMYDAIVYQKDLTKDMITLVEAGVAAATHIDAHTVENLCMCVYEALQGNFKLSLVKGLSLPPSIIKMYEEVSNKRSSGLSKQQKTINEIRNKKRLNGGIY